MELSNFELKFQKQIVDYCRSLRMFYNGWKSNLEDYKTPLQRLLNLSEQLRNIEKADLYYMDHFTHAQRAIQCEIVGLVEEEVAKLRQLIEKLNEITQTFKNKLITLETNSLNLDWSKENELIIGSGCQPSLENLLEKSLIALQFFSVALKNVNEHYKALDIRNDESVRELEKSLSIDLSEKKILYLLAITQYVGNESINRV